MNPLMKMNRAIAIAAIRGPIVESKPVLKYSTQVEYGENIVVILRNKKRFYCDPVPETIDVPVPSTRG